MTTILLFGTAWGLIEATLGGVLHLMRLPFTGAIMASIGFALLYAALRAGVRPSRLLFISLIAAGFKFLDIPLFGLPLFAQTVINPAVAIASQGLAAALLLRGDPGTEGVPALALRMLGSAALAMLLFNAVSVLGFGWQTFQSRDPLGAGAQLLITALSATALARLGASRSLAGLVARRPGWQAASALAAASLAIAARILLH